MSIEEVFGRTKENDEAYAEWLELRAQIVTYPSEIYRPILAEVNQREGLDFATMVPIQRKRDLLREILQKCQCAGGN